METMINLNDLLKHEIMDLYSAEEQIIEAMPKMIEKAKNPELKKALREHLKITEEQKNRLDKVKQSFGEGDGQGSEGEEGGEKKGFFSRLFGGSGGEKCKGMEGLITEGEKIMKADITDEALDAAIIASAQKIEHYEICGYGTARAFARELQLAEVERLLSETLNEEYKADDLLTALAVGKLNLEAEQADGMDGRGRSGRSNRTGESNKGSSGSSSKGGSKSSGGGSSKSSSKGSSSKGGSKSSVGGSSKGSSKGGSSKGGSKSSVGGSSKGSSKGGSSKGGSKSSVGGSSKGSSKGGYSKGSKSSVGGSSKSSSKGGSSKGSKSSVGGRGGSSKVGSKGGNSGGRGRSNGGSKGGSRGR